MATTAKYFVLPSANLVDFIDFELSYGTLSLQGQEIVFVGSTAVDAVFVRPGVVVDFTGSGASADKVYLSGNLADYAAAIAGTQMTLTRGSDADQETVRFVASPTLIASDKLVFADGSVSTFDLRAHLQAPGTTPLPTPTGETSVLPGVPAAVGSELNATIKAFALDSTGVTFAPAQHGISLTVVGGTGVDTVYVPDGGQVDASGLGASKDLIYFRGAWDDYSKLAVGTTITFTRTVDGKTESVKVTAGNNAAQNDQLIFADGAVLSYNARVSVTANVDAAITDVQGYDPNTVTPGLDTIPPPLSVSAIGDGNLTASEAAVGVISVTTEAGATVTVLLTGASGQVTKTLIGTGEAQPVMLDANDLATLGDGEVTLHTIARDTAGNTSPGDTTGSFSLDTLPPEITVTEVGDGNLTAEETATGVVSVNAESGAGVSVVFTGSEGNVTKPLSGTGEAQNVALEAEDLLALGDGAVSVVVTATDAAGNVASSDEGGFTLDTTAPVLSSAVVNGNLLTLTYTEANGLDSVNIAAVTDFTVLVNGSQDGFFVNNVAVIGNEVVLALDNNIANGSSVTLSYAGLGPAAIQDLAGNDAAQLDGMSVTVPSGNVADGYIRDAHIYIDTTGNGIGDHDTGVFTNASGNFFLPPGTPVGTIIAIGGVNIDTGVPNTLIYKAPAGSTTVSPLTTLVQAYADTNDVSAADAETAVQTKLGLPEGVDLLTFDPLAADPTDADAVAVQKAAAQISTVAMLAEAALLEGADAGEAAMEVFNNLVISVTEATDPVDLAVIAPSLLGGSTDVTPEQISTAATAIADATNFSQISNAQAVALDNVSPAAPTHAPDLLASSDTGRLGNDDVTQDATPSLRVRFDAVATNGTAAVAGDLVKVFDGANQVGSAVLNSNDIANGFIDITTSALSDGIRTLSATLTDVAGNIGNASATLNVQIDTAAPTTSLSGISLSTDTGSSANDFLTKVAAQTISATLSAPLAAGEHVYGSTNGGATWNEITGSVSGVDLSWNTLLRNGSNMLQLKVSDTAGNSGPVASQTYTLDILPPTLSVAGVGDGNLNVDEATGAGGVITVNTETGANVSVVFSGAAGTVNKTLVGNGGTQAVTLTTGDLAALGNGAVNVATTTADAAGNTRFSTVGGFNLDTATSAAPVLQSASVNGGVITLTYNEALDPAHQPASSYFLATVNGNNRGVRDIAISGNSVMINLGNAPVSQGDSVTVSYSDPSAGNDVFAVQNVAGNDAAGFTAMAVTNQTVGNASVTSVVSATFSTANASISYVFNEPMQASSPSGVTILKNGIGGNILTGASFSADGYTLTFTTNASLSADDFVVVSYNGGGDLRDMSGNLVSQGTLVIGGGNANNIDLDTLSGTHGQFTVRGNGGDDVILGSNNNDTLHGNAGGDTINGGWGQDSIRLYEGTNRASDTVVVWRGDESGSQPYMFDSVFGFDVSGTTTNDKLDLPSDAIATSTSGFVNGIDVGALKSHSIGAGGILSFGSTDAGTPILINAGNLNDATAYLLQNLTAPGQAMAFAFDNDGNGQADSQFVYQNGGGSDFYNKVLVKLVGVNGATLGTSAEQNVVQLVDSSAPNIFDAGFSATANAVFSLSFNENVLVTDTTGISLLKNGAGGNIVTGVSANGNVLNIQTNATLAATDYVLFAYDGATGNVRDVNANSMASELPGIAIGGTGNSTIDLSALSGEYGIYDPSGNNTLIGNADENWLEGGAGNDTLIGGGGNDELRGGPGADNLDGGAGEDEFRFEQGDSTAVSYNAGVYTFAGNVADVISGGFDVAATNLNVNVYNETGDRIRLDSPIPGQGGISYMGAAPADSLVTDQSYYLTRGDYNAGIFTNNTVGNDTLVVYDGSSAIGATSQTALVLQGVIPSQLAPTSWGDIHLSGSDSNYSQIFGTPGEGQPAVNSVRIQNDYNFHQPGETLVEYVYFDQSVLVSGAPQLQLVIGVAGNYHTVLADYDAANSGGNRVAFNYTLQAGDVGQMSVGNLYMPTGASITNLAGSLNAFLGIDNTGNNQASVWIYGEATQTGTAANDWIAPLAGTNTDTAAALTSTLSGLNAGSGGERDMLAFDVKYFGGELSDAQLANGWQLNADGRSLQISRNDGTVNLYELVNGTPQLVKTLYTSGDGGFERLLIRLTDPDGIPLGEDYQTDLELVSGVYTDLIRNNQMNHGSIFADTITLPANPSAFQMVWPSDGDDIVIGSNNADHSDVSDGNDNISLGGGDDHFGWWGIGSSTLDGGSGNDTLTLSGGIVPQLGGEITSVLGGDGMLYLYAGSTEFAVIEQGGAGDAWQYRITSMEDDPGDMVVTLKDIENFQVGNQSDWLSLALSPALFAVADTIAPVSTGASFSNTANAVITLNYSEAVTGSNVASLSLSLNPGEANDWQGTPIILNGMPSGLGTATVTLPTSATLTAGDVVRLRYDAGFSDLADLAGNPVPSAEIWMGGSGANEIDLDNYWSYLPVTLRGNGGNDRLVGTNANDLLLDGGGADTLLGGWGADTIILVENGTTIPFSRDVVKIEPGESIFGAMDVIRSSATSPTTSGFDIASPDVANHDVLDLPSNTIAANASNVDGVDGGGISRHSVTGGIVTFLDAGGNPMLAGSLQNALSYLSANFTTPGETVAFKSDTDSNGVVDSLHVFQDNGTVPLTGNIVLPDTLVRLQNLIGIESATLGTTAGANVVQIVDTQAPEPVGIALTADSLQFNFAENAFVPAAGVANLALTMQKNGAGAVLSPTSVEGNGSTVMTLHYALTLAPEDWVMMHYAGTGVADGIADASGNALTEEAGGFNFAEGGSGNNTIDLSALSTNSDLNGNAGNDILIGSSGENWIVGGAGADTMTGGDGHDEFAFEQGDSPAVTARNLGANGLLNDGDTFSFANGVDRITDLSSGEAIELNRSMNDFFGNLGELYYMGSVPANGLVTDQGYFALQGDFNAGVFTADTAGADTLIVWDGDSSSAVTQTGIVLSGVQAGQLQLGGSWIRVQASVMLTHGDDTYTLPAPTPSLLRQTVDALGGSDTLLIPFHPNFIVPDGEGLHFGEVLDLASISTDSVVYTLGKASETSHYLVGIHDVLAQQPVVDYGLLLQNFEHVKFEDGTGVLNIDLANDIGVVTADQAVAGVLNGLILADDYRFASYEAGTGVSQIIGGAQMADTAGFFFTGVEEIQMLMDDSGAAPVWRFSEASNEVFNLVQAGSNWEVDYASNGAGVDVTLSNIEYVAVLNGLDDVLLRLSLLPDQPQIIV